MKDHPNKSTAARHLTIVHRTNPPPRTHTIKANPIQPDDEIASRLPALTFGQLAMLKRVGTAFSATIRKTGPGYTIEIDVGPRRWVLVSTHRKKPRVFLHLDGAARTVGRLNAQTVVLELGDPPDELTAPPSASPSERVKP